MADYKFELTIPEARIPEMVDAFGKGWNPSIGIDDNGDPIPNPQTKANFAKESFDFKIKKFIHSQVMQYRKDNVALDNDEIVG